LAYDLPLINLKFGKDVEFCVFLNFCDFKEELCTSIVKDIVDVRRKKSIYRNGFAKWENSDTVVRERLWTVQFAIILA
jgi:hypothetical protein